MRSAVGTLLLVWALLASGCASGPRRYLAVVPQELPNGESSAEARRAFESWLLETAGGFTRLDAVEGGWVSPEGVVFLEANHLYLVSFPKGRRTKQPQLEAQIMKLFDQQAAYVEKW